MTSNKIAYVHPENETHVLLYICTEVFQLTYYSLCALHL